ncbi:MAG: glycosyltransferase [Acidobacteria bacterium]|nr:glycosyltransferase [Acidobacteriota bacterium]
MATEVATAIVRVLTRLGAGGPPLHAVLLTREMSERGYPSVLVTGRCAAQDGDMSYLLRPGDPVQWIEEMSRAVSPWQDLKALARLYRLLRQRRPAIVHTHTAKAGVLGRVAARLAGVPVVVHTFHGNVLAHYFPAPVSWGIRMLERGLARLTDAICTLSPQQAAELAGRYRIAPRHKIHVIPLGLELGPFEELGPARDGPLVAGWLGRFVPVKDIPLLCRIVRAAPERVRFLIAGDGPERPALERLAGELGPDRCRVLAWQRDVKPAIAQCHVLIQTSRNEGTPVALIQGMAAGRPFVSTPAGGVVDMVCGQERLAPGGSRGFDNAILAPPDAAAFAAVLGELAGEPRRVQAMGQAARAFAQAHYALPALLAALDRLYSELLRKKTACTLCCCWLPALYCFACC